MKVALVHDYLKEYGGAEKVLEVFHEMYPDAVLYTTFYSPQYLGPHAERFKNWDIRTTWFDKIPLKNKLLSYFRLIAPFVFMSLDLSSYDLVITSCAGTYTSPNFVKIGKHTKLISYCHTPPRYLYGYETAAPWKTVWWRKALTVLGIIPMHFLRLLDFQAAQRPHQFIANSQEVAARIEKFYRRKAVIIYPPVDAHLTPEKPAYILPEKFFLAGGRLARPKHIDLIVATCTKMKLQLLVFGKEFSGYGQELHAIAGPAVQFLGEISNGEKTYLYEHAKAFIFAAKDEDFGVMPVESMFCGTPVIAYPAGGVLETVVDGKTGLFFKDFSVEGLSQTLKDFEKKKWNKAEIKKHAQKFSKENFEKEIREVVGK